MRPREGRRRDSPCGVTLAKRLPSALSSARYPQACARHLTPQNAEGLPAPPPLHRSPRPRALPAICETKASATRDMAAARRPAAPAPHGPRRARRPLPGPLRPPRPTRRSAPGRGGGGEARKVAAGRPGTSGAADGGGGALPPARAWLGGRGPRACVPAAAGSGLGEGRARREGSWRCSVSHFVTKLIFFPFFKNYFFICERAGAGGGADSARGERLDLPAPRSRPQWDA